MDNMNPQRKTEPFEGEKWFSKHSKKEEDIKTVNREKEIVIKFQRLTREKTRFFTRGETKRRLFWGRQRPVADQREGEKKWGVLLAVRGGRTEWKKFWEEAEEETEFAEKKKKGEKARTMSSPSLQLSTEPTLHGASDPEPRPGCSLVPEPRRKTRETAFSL